MKATAVHEKLFFFSEEKKEEKLCNKTSDGFSRKWTIL